MPYPARDNPTVTTGTLVDRHATYAHNDPNSAAPKNALVKALIPFLRGIARR